MRRKLYDTLTPNRIFHESRINLDYFPRFTFQIAIVTEAYKINLGPRCDRLLIEPFVITNKACVNAETIHDAPPRPKVGKLDYKIPINNL